MPAVSNGGFIGSDDRNDQRSSRIRTYGLRNMKTRSRQILLSFFAMIAVAGCANSGPVSIGSDTYMLAKPGDFFTYLVAP